MEKTVSIDDDSGREGRQSELNQREDLLKRLDQMKQSFESSEARVAELELLLKVPVYLPTICV
jgi:hypothetical protein